jgi:hypothetical protein
MKSFTPLRKAHLSIEYFEAQMKSEFTVTIAVIGFQEKVSFGGVGLRAEDTRTRMILPPYSIAIPGGTRSA